MEVGCQQLLLTCSYDKHPVHSLTHSSAHAAGSRYPQGQGVINFFAEEVGLSSPLQEAGLCAKDQLQPCLSTLHQLGNPTHFPHQVRAPCSAKLASQAARIGHVHGWPCTWLILAMPLVPV